MSTAVLIVFCLTYAGIAIGHGSFFRLDRTGYALLGATAMLIMGGISLKGAVQAVSWPSIIMLFSLMVVAAQLHYSGAYNRLANCFSRFLSHPRVFLAVLMLVSGVLSAFLNNDVVCLAFTPVVAVALVKKNLNPVPFLIALAISSNIGCAFTLIGNAQNVLIGGVAHLSFSGYLVYAALPVLICLIVAYLIILKIAGGKWELEHPVVIKHGLTEDMPFNTWRVIKGVGILAIIVCFFLFSGIQQYVVAMAGAGLLLCSRRLESRKVLELVNWQLLLLFIALFVVIGAFSNSGLSDQLTARLQDWNVNLSDHFTLVWVTTILSNLINNSAAVMLLLEIGDFSNPENGYLLAMTNAIAGNLLLIGSLANVIVAQVSESMGIHISFRMFAKFGIPVTLACILVVCGWAFL